MKEGKGEAAGHSVAPDGRASEAAGQFCSLHPPEGDSAYNPTARGSEGDGTKRLTGRNTYSHLRLRRRILSMKLFVSCISKPSLR